MPRIFESDLERLKAEVSLERLAEADGVELVRKGQDLHGRCPFHEDKTPSLVISPAKNLWHCLGACQTGGTVVDWVMRKRKVSFRHAVEILRTGLPPSPSPPPQKRAKKSTSRKLPGLAAANVEDQALLVKVVGFYHQALQEDPDALGYLEKRGLQSAEMVREFRLGLSNRTLGYRLPTKDSEDGRELRGRLQELGVLRQTGHEHFRGCLVVPLFGENGELVQMYGRRLGNVRKGATRHIYLPGPQRGVFNLAALKASEEVVLCESILDALTFWCAGIRNVSCTYGTSGLHEDLRQALVRHGTRRVLLAFDRDPAGDKAAEAVAEELLGLGMDVYRIQFPKGLDANEYAQKVQPAGKSLGLAVRHAVWMGAGQAPQAAAKGGSPGGERPREGESDVDASPPTEPPLSSAPAPVAPARPAQSERAEEAPGPPSSLAALPSCRVSPMERPGGLAWSGEECRLVVGDRTYRVRDLGKNLSPSVMKVNVMVTRGEVTDPLAGAGFHVDTLDLYLSRPRDAFSRRAAMELGVEEATVRRDMGRLLGLLEQAQDQAIQKRLAPKAEAVEMTDAEREDALALLRSPDLLARILEDYQRCGVVGEETNKLVGYLAAVSRKLKAPLAVVIQSSSAAGKSSLQDAVLRFVPKEERVSYSAMTGQSLFYMSGTDLRHKILAVAEEEGAERASYALKLLQSEGELTIASTGKDSTTGRLTTHEYHVEGPVMIFLTTTAIDMDEELLNRCLVLTVDEGREQTRAIHKLQRDLQTLDGVFEDEAKDAILLRHQNAQRLLRPLRVVNPFAHELTFLDHRTRCRRDHTKYLTLIQAIALLHQYQREVKTARRGEQEVTYVEVTREDIATADRLLGEVLGRSLDELPPQTRRLLGGITDMVRARCEAEGIPKEEVRFTRRDVRQFTGVGNTQAKVHLQRLEELEYLLVHSGGRGQSMVYELLVEDEPAPSNILEDRQAPLYDRGGRGRDGGWSAPSRGQVGPKSGGGRGRSRPPENGSSSDLEEEKQEKNPDSSPEALLGARVAGGRTVGRSNGTQPPDPA